MASTASRMCANRSQIGGNAAKARPRRAKPRAPSHVEHDLRSASRFTRPVAPAELYEAIRCQKEEQGADLHVIESAQLVKTLLSWSRRCWSTA